MSRKNSGALRAGLGLALSTCFLFGGPPAQAQEDSYVPLRRVLERANERYREGSFVEAGAGYREALSKIPSQPGESVRAAKLRQMAAYNLACCESLSGHLDEALEALNLALAAGFSDWAHLNADPDLEALRRSPAYASIRSRCPRPSCLDGVRAAKLAEPRPVPSIYKNDHPAPRLILIWSAELPLFDAESPALTELKALAAQGFEVSGLALSREAEADAEARLRRRERELGLNFRSAILNRQQLARDPMIQGLPTVLAIDLEGNERARVLGLAARGQVLSLAAALLEISAPAPAAPTTKAPPLPKTPEPEARPSSTQGPELEPEAPKRRLF